MKKNFKTLFGIYLISLFFFSLVFLIEKHNGGSDSTISEWLINYSGGFTKRGLIGQFCIFFAKNFNQNLRDVILIFQICLIGVYYILIFDFAKNIKINKIIFLSIFTPIFLLYPVAEIEVLARKEVFIFCIFLIYLFFDNFIKKCIYKIVVLPIAVLIWEPVIFYFLFFVVLDVIEENFIKIEKKFLLSLLTYIPALSIAAYIVFNPISNINHQIMANHLQVNFNEACYMSCALLKSKSSLYAQFHGNFDKYSLTIFFRYFLIILIGFGPLFILLKNSSLTKSNLFFFKYFKNLFLPVIIVLFPVIFLFAMGYDWGRWVNISYVFSIIFYLYLYQNKKILLNKDFLETKIFKYLNSKKIFATLVLIFCFGWNPKTTITGDVASKPGYQIPKKTIEIIYKNLSKK